MQLEANLEVEENVEAEGSEVVGMENVRMTGGTQLSVMEINEEEKDEVIVVEETKQGETWKQAPLSPPKTLRKRVCVAMGTQPSVGSQVGSGNVGSMGRPCERCVKH